MKIFVFRSLIFLLFLSLVFITQRFWFANAWRWIGRIALPAPRFALQAAWVGAAVLIFCVFLNPLLKRLLGHGLSSWASTAARLWLVASFFAFFVFHLVGGLGWTSQAVAKVFSSSPENLQRERRDFFRYAAYLASSLPFLAATYGFATGRLNYKVRNVRVPIKDLPQGLDGLKIVQLSDIHIGEFLPKEELRRAVRMANDLGGHLAVVTGDFISGEGDPLEDCIAELSHLQAPLGIWGCNGNHEIYAGAEDAAQQLFDRHGMKLLRQESAQLDWGGAKFNLLGVDYQRDHMTPGPHGKTLSQIEHLVRRDMPNILLSHNPNSFRRAAELGIELSLAGHTHGGQVQFEIVDHSISPARLITEFVAGLYRLPFSSKSGNGQDAKTSFLYVNRGLGTFGMPVRLGVPPEITLLTLRSA